MISEEVVLIDGVDEDGYVSCEANPPDRRPAWARILFRCPVPGCDSKGRIFLCRPCLERFLKGSPAWSVCSVHGPQAPVIPERII